MKLTTATSAARPNSRAADMEAFLALLHPQPTTGQLNPPPHFSSAAAHFFFFCSTQQILMTRYLKKKGRCVLRVCLLCKAGSTGTASHTAQHWPSQHKHTGHHQRHDIHSKELPTPNGHVCFSYLETVPET